MRLRHILIILAVAFPFGGLVSFLISRPAGIDEAQSRICRAVLPAIVADGAVIQVTRVARAAAGSVRIDYRVTEKDRPPRGRQILCTFAGEGLAPGAADLMAIATERGRMSDAALFFLRRYWLDRPASWLVIPPAPDRGAWLGPLSRPVGYALQQALAALPLIAVTGLMATAYALVYGLVGRIVLTFGEFAALGATGATLGVALAQSWGVAATLAVVAIGFGLAAWLTATWGAAAARFVFAPMMRRPGQNVLIATVGLALAMSEGIRVTQGTSGRWLSPIWNAPMLVAEAPGFAVTTTPVTLGVAAAGLAAALLLAAAMQKSRYGRAWRAVADDRVAAELAGVDPARIVLIACALACGVAGLAGFLLTLQIGGMGFAGGAVFGLKALVGAILGGVGSVGGALAGGLAVGIIEAVWSATMPIEWRDVVVFSLLSLTLIFRPGGLFGDGGPVDKPQGRAS